MHLSSKVKACVFILLLSNVDVCVCGYLSLHGWRKRWSNMSCPQALQLNSVFSLSLGRMFCHIDFTCIKNSSLEMKGLDLSHYFRFELATELIVKWHTHTNHISYVTNNWSKANIPTLIIYLMSLAHFSFSFSGTSTNRLQFLPTYSLFKFSQQFKRKCLPTR